MAPPFLADIYEEHLAEAAFRWSQWERALAAPDYNLEETARVEELLLAHLDGLVLGGSPVADEVLRPALDSEEPLYGASALWALLEGNVNFSEADVLALLRTSAPEKLGPLKRVLELSEQRSVDDALCPLLQPQATEAPLQALALDVQAFRGALPKQLALDLLQHSDPRVVAAALRGLCPLSGDVATRELPRLLLDGHPEVRQAAIETGIISGSRMAWAQCRAVAEERKDAGRWALVLLAQSGEEGDLPRVIECSRVASLRADALLALGFSGRVQAVEVCLELMAHAPLAALAGEAFSAITGLRLEQPYVLLPEEQDFLPPLEEDLAQELTLRPEDALPVPDATAVAAWWRGARKDFSPGTRYLRGRVFNTATLLEELEQGVMRSRPVHALSLAIRTHGGRRLQTRAFTRRQRAQLQEARAARRGHADLP
ncbi:TIGR02270 family protein [Myxococcus sp. AM011]|uniref:TIGR02270 family protein n=1 Tax=Myxococcus sp. AM011 TaxID=2745200 RepID=UPI001595CA8E|nr:TIGR02270 family protein [Myxococcus sp. AM011]NVJ24191.1 TIGR02270 family protein [Myxococcus sp. AM011]